MIVSVEAVDLVVAPLPLRVSLPDVPQMTSDAGPPSKSPPLKTVQAALATGACTAATSPTTATKPPSSNPRTTPQPLLALDAIGFPQSADGVRHRLLLETDRLEGFGVVGVVIDARDSSIADAAHLGRVYRERNAAPRADHALPPAH